MDFQNVMVFGIILATVVPIIFILLCVAICCVLPCCLFHKKCLKQRIQRQMVVTDDATNVPQPPYSPSGYQASLPGYQAVPAYEDSMLPAAPPPSYMESIASSYPPAPFLPGHAMYPLTPPNQPCALPPPTDAVPQFPYNPSYGPQP